MADPTDTTDGKPKKRSAQKTPVDASPPSTPPSPVREIDVQPTAITTSVAATNPAMTNAASTIPSSPIPSRPSSPSPALTQLDPNWLSYAQTHLRDAYIGLARAFAKATTQFHEEQYVEPENASPSWIRLIPGRERTTTTPTRTINGIEDLITTRQKAEVHELGRAMKDIVMRQVVHSLAKGKKPVLSGIAKDQLPDAERYAHHVSGILKTPMEALRAALPKGVSLEKLLDRTDFHEDLAQSYLYYFGEDRITIPKFTQENVGQGQVDRFVNARVVLPFRHFAGILGTENAWWSAKYLPDMYRRFSRDSTIHLGIIDTPAHFLRKLMRRRLLKNTEGFAITEDHVAEYAAFAYPFIHAPGVVPLLEEYAKSAGKHFPDAKRGVEHGIANAEAHLGVSASAKNASELAEILKETGAVTYTPFSSGGLLPKNANAQEKQLLHWFEDFINTSAMVAKLYKRTIVDPLAGWNYTESDTDENLGANAARITDKRHALLVKDPLGHYLIMEKELNERTGIFHKHIYGLSHEAVVLGKAAVGEIVNDAMGIVDKLSSYTPLPAPLVERLHDIVVARLPTAGRDTTYRQLREATFHGKNQAVRPNAFGAFIDEHKLELGAFVATKMVRNLWDHSSKGILDTFVEKTWGAVTSGEWGKYAIDMLSFRPEDAHTKSYGGIELEMLPMAEATIAHVARRNAGKNGMDIQLLAGRITDELLEHDDNIVTLFAAGTFLHYETLRSPDNRRMHVAYQKLQDVQGWIEHARSENIEQDDKYDTIFLYHQLLPATEYQLAQIMRHQGKELGHVDMLRHAYRQYKKRSEAYKEPIPGTTNAILRRRVVDLDLPDAGERSLEDVMRALILSPMNFSYRRSAAEMLGKTEAHAMLAESVMMLSAIGAKDLSAADIEETYRIERLGAQYNVRLPDAFVKERAARPEHEELASRYPALPPASPEPLRALPEPVRIVERNTHNTAHVRKGNLAYLYEGK